MISRNVLSCLVLLGTCALFGFAPLQDEGKDKSEEGFVSIFNGKDLTGFKSVLQSKKENVDTFTVKDDALQISGKPAGYLHTEKIYKNYVLRYDWECIDPHGNNLLLHVSGDLKVWPNCVEFLRSQGLNPLNSKGKFRGGSNWKKVVKQGAGEWNAVEITSQDGSLTVKINDAQICSGKCDELTGGHIAFMSEGGKFQVKNVRIKELP